MKINPSTKLTIMTDFKRGAIVFKLANDYTHGRKGIVMDVNVNTGQSKVYWFKPGITKWCSWLSLSLLQPSLSDIYNRTKALRDQLNFGAAGLVKSS